MKNTMQSIMKELSLLGLTPDTPEGAVKIFNASPLGVQSAIIYATEMLTANPDYEWDDLERQMLTEAYIYLETAIGEPIEMDNILDTFTNKPEEYRDDIDMAIMFHRMGIA